jgi:hypothetical protein
VIGDLNSKDKHTRVPPAHSPTAEGTSTPKMRHTGAYLGTPGLCHTIDPLGFTCLNRRGGRVRYWRAYCLVLPA